MRLQCHSDASTGPFVVQILADMKGPAPMVRLLQGDVGSGKTAVAFLALLAAVGSGWQGAMMAPTEVSRLHSHIHDLVGCILWHGSSPFCFSKS